MENNVRRFYFLYDSRLFYLGIKRLADLLVSLIALTLFLPVIPFIALAIAIDSPGPVFYNQKRIGLNGKVFTMYKFRTMVRNADERLYELVQMNEVKGCMFKIKDDPRITRVGRILRRTSIDEFPQFVNVLIGEMSIVGPRPPIIHEVNKYETWHNLRLSVKPGITGLWQTSGRSSLGFDEMVRLDLKYIRERGFRCDIRIMLKTIPLLFGDDKAF